MAKATTPAELTSTVPDGLEDWTADEVAEVLSYGKFLPEDYKAEGLRPGPTVETCEEQVARCERGGPNSASIHMALLEKQGNSTEIIPEIAQLITSNPFWYGATLAEFRAEVEARAAYQADAYKTWLAYRDAALAGEGVPMGEGMMGLHNRLYSFLNDAQNATPLGGDGSDGTVEEPHQRYDEDHDDKASHWWGKLTRVEQTAIAQAYALETDA